MAFGHLVAGDEPAAVRDQLVGLDRQPRSTTDGVRRPRPSAGSGTPNTAASSTAGMLVERVLDLGAVHVLAAADDHVLGAVDEEQVAVVVQVAEVAGPVPAVDEGLGRGLAGCSSSRPSRSGRAPATSPTSPGGTSLPSGVDDGDLDADGRLAARARRGRVEHALLVRQQGHDRRGLGGAVDMEQLGVGEGGVGAPQRLGGEWASRRG